jgi:hypothetical protein
MVVKKVLPVTRIVSVLRDTPATKEMDSAIEVAATDEALIFSSIPDLKASVVSGEVWGVCGGVCGEV